METTPALRLCTAEAAARTTKEDLAAAARRVGAATRRIADLAVLLLVSTPPPMHARVTSCCWDRVRTMQRWVRSCALTGVSAAEVARANVPHTWCLYVRWSLRPST